MYGHEKAEYFSAGVEGALILVAAASIAFYAIGRLIHPVPISDVGVGIAVSAAASAVNLSVGMILIRAGRTRQSGRRSFVSLHMLVPGTWTIQQGRHDLSERLESEIRAALPHASVLTHLEPVEDPASFDDEALDR